MSEPHRSTTNPAPAENTSSKKETKPRSSIERAIVWSCIAILGGVAAFEARQKLAYDSAIARIGREFQDQDESGKYHTLSEVMPMIRGFTSQVTIPHLNPSLKTITVKWTSVAKDYRLSLIMERTGDDPPVIGFTTPNVADAPAEANSSTEGSNSIPLLSQFTLTSSPRMGEKDDIRPGSIPIIRSENQRSEPISILSIVKQDSVVAEVQLTSSQIQQLGEFNTALNAQIDDIKVLPDGEQPAALKAAYVSAEESIGKVLEEMQFHRLKQLFWRQIGLLSLEREDVCMAIGVTDVQKDSLTKLLGERTASLLKSNHPDSNQEQERREDWDRRLRAAITDDQFEKWKQLLGDEPNNRQTEKSTPKSE